MYPEEGLLVLPSFKTGIRGWGGILQGPAGRLKPPLGSWGRRAYLSCLSRRERGLRCEFQDIGEITVASDSGNLKRQSPVPYDHNNPLRA